MPKFRHDSGRIVETDDHAQANRYRQSHRFEEIFIPDVIVPAGTVAEVLEWVGDDDDRRHLALIHELGNKNRATLIDKLTK